MANESLTVYGHTFDGDLLAALIARMKAAPFKAADIEAEAIRLGVPCWSAHREPVAMRVADRLIQRERKAGRLRLQRPLWVRVGD